MFIIEFDYHLQLQAGGSCLWILELLHELGYLIFEGLLQSLSGEGHSPGAVAGSGAPKTELEPNRGCAKIVQGVWGSAEGDRSRWMAAQVHRPVRGLFS